MLARLARWLRALGCDTALAGEGEADAALVRRARAEGRLLLTRDRRLAADAPEDCLLLTSGEPMAQLRMVLAHAGVARAELRFTRCLLCNTPLEPADAGDPRVPAAIRDASIPVLGCPECGRLYWEGAHTRRMRAALARAFGA